MLRLVSDNIKAVRTRLRLIRYYSAPRPRNLLTKFVDVALVLAIVLALPATWFANAEIVQEAVLIERDGHLTRTDDGGVKARLLVPGVPNAPRDDVPYGEFHLKLVEQRTGWPVGTTVTHPRVILELNRYDQPTGTHETTLDTDSAEYQAILEALEEGRFSEMLGNDDHPSEREAIDSSFVLLIDRWKNDDEHVDHRLAGWVINTAVSWAILSGILSLIATALWVIVLIILHNRRLKQTDRRREGLCGACGYDLYGLDFNDRCPECGTIIH